jgi:hypothetical protein
LSLSVRSYSSTMRLRSFRCPSSTLQTYYTILLVVCQYLFFNFYNFIIFSFRVRTIGVECYLVHLISTDVRVFNIPQIACGIFYCNIRPITLVERGVYGVLVYIFVIDRQQHRNTDKQGDYSQKLFHSDYLSFLYCNYIIALLGASVNRFSESFVKKFFYTFRIQKWVVGLYCKLRASLAEGRPPN